MTMPVPMPAEMLTQARAAERRNEDIIVRTPVLRLDDLGRQLGGLGGLACKLDHHQVTGTFKARGALNSARLNTQAAEHGLVAFSAGNHAIAAAFAARALGVSAKVIMPKTASPFRADLARKFGGEVILANSRQEASDLAAAIAATEGRAQLHPFNDPPMIAGAATLALEFIEDAPFDLEAIIVSVGGGGLAAGVACIAKELLPNCAVYGVEPIGAANMRASLDAGAPRSADFIDTIADSLAPPGCLPHSFSICQAYLNDVVLVSDQAIVDAMALWRAATGEMLEPAAAATIAAASGPLQTRLTGKRVGLVICGANISPPEFEGVLARA